MPITVVFCDFLGCEFLNKVKIRVKSSVESFIVKNQYVKQTVPCKVFGVTVFLSSVQQITKPPCADMTAGLTISCHTLSVHRYCSAVQCVKSVKSKTVCKLHITNVIATLEPALLYRGCLIKAI